MLTPTLLSAALLALPTLISAQGLPYLSPVLLQPGLSQQKCIQPLNSNSADGTAVVLADCTGATAQEWFFSGNTIRVFSNKCIAVPGGNSTNGVQLRIQTCNAADTSQQWNYNPFNRNQISWLNKGKCMDLTGGSLANGNAVQIWDCSTNNVNQKWDAGYLSTAQPATSEASQTGYNNCGTTSSQGAHCQTAWINDVDDFCLWAPPEVGSIGDDEREVVAWCTKSGRGTRVIPNGTLQGVHFVKTPDYVQVTGVGDLTQILVKPKDAGGELDPHGADGKGNPVGGLVYGNSFGQGLQYHEWSSFIGAGLFCFRACNSGPRAADLCPHIYDIEGCFWNMPGNYDSGVFESCSGDDDLPAGVYGTSTFHQGQNPTPSAHPAAPSSNCRRLATVTSGPVATTSPPPQSTTSAPPTGPTSPVSGHVIHPHVSATKCLNAVSQADGAHVTIQDCNGSAAQAWTQSGTTLRVFSTFCLDVTDGVNASGTKMQIWTCGNNNPNQQFTTDSQKQIVWSGKDKCLDLTDGVSTNGQQMQVWQCSTGNNNQVWTIV